MNDKTFYSPYQFIPVTGRLRQPAADPANGSWETREVPKETWQDIAAGQTRVRHDGWGSDTLSGRLLCRLTTVTPTLVGAERKPANDGVPIIANYRLKGELAIPGSSLRGAIGSVAEALSQSAMRVLKQRAFSVRKSMRHSLKAIGILRRQPDGHWRLLPLAMTGLPTRYNSDPPEIQVHQKWKRVFPGSPPLGECVSAYFGNYLDPDDDPARFDCFQEAESPQFVYSSMALDQRLTETRIGSPYEIGENDAFRLSGQFALRRQLSDVVADPAGLSGGVMRGVAYVLGRRSDHDLMPKKRHEWFVPYADDWEERLAKARPDGQSTLRVRPDTIATFERIAAERDAANKEDTPRDYRRPFLPKGYRSRHPIRADGRGGFLHSGDLVYFDVDNSGQEVTEISFSAIWRDSIGGHLYGSFSRTATPDVLPWHRRDPDDDRRPGRDALTPAECLFGVVDDLPRVRRVGDAARNLASRVRFSDARGLAAPALFYPEDQPLPYLRQLQSPKPPSPAMYFRNQNGGAVRKHTLDLTTQVPNGRKQYLPHPPDDALNGRPWETRKLAGVAPSDMALILPGYIKDGGHYGNPLADRQELWFHVDFENLSQAELDLLCTAIDPNTSRLSPENAPDFHHRLGWGRPLGLGIVRIEIAGIFLIARPVRYSSKGLDGPRYQGRWLSQSANDTLLRSRYPDELTEPCNLKLPEPLKVAAELIDLEALEVLLRLGDVDAIDGPVCYPYTAQQSPASEEEGFKWFVDNDHHPDTDYQFLEPVNGPDGILPALKAR